jgi:hypothetical protein
MIEIDIILGSKYISPWREEMTCVSGPLSINRSQKWLRLEKCDSRKARQTASKLFGKDIASLVAIDGTEYSKPLFDLIILYACAFF